MSYILLENRKVNDGQKSSHYFHGKYTRISCTKLQDIKDCLNRIEYARKSGNFLVGYLSYEASYGLCEKILSSYKYFSPFPLIDFYIFENHELLTQTETDYLLEVLIKENRSNEPIIYNLEFSFDQEDYTTYLNQIKEYIINGETYQTNFTGKYKFQLQGCPIQLYRKLRDRQKVEFSALFNCENFQLLSLSPELFFEKKGENFRSKPMKGTAPRSNNNNLDDKNKSHLASDPKIAAENMIIVDLIRNDLSIIAQSKSVSVAKLFEIEQYNTVYQMTSTITCKVNKHISFGDIISSIFPCGSITGAPKIRTMQIIRELEQQDRGIYTGTIGYITPENDMCFNVAIRTLHIANNKGEMGVGGGIVYDSVIRDEYEEIKTKAKFLTELATPFDLIECFLYNEKIGFRYLNEHLQRLHNSAKIFNFKFYESDILKNLAELADRLDPQYSYKIKIILKKNGHFNVISDAVDNQVLKRKIKIIDNSIVTINNILYHHKTTISSIRGMYDELFLYENKRNNLFDIVFMNEEGFITEGSKSNIFIEKNDKVLTPALSCGILPGIMREKFIKKNYPNIIETYLTKEDIMSADKIWMTNSIVEIVEVELI